MVGQPTAERGCHPMYSSQSHHTVGLAAHHPRSPHLSISRRLARHPYLSPIIPAHAGIHVPLRSGGTIGGHTPTLAPT